MIRRIVAAVKGIGASGEAGSIVPEFQQPEIRERLVYHYRIIYRIRNATPDVTEIVKIIHGSRRLNDI